MNNLFPVNVRKIGNVTLANDNYSLSTEQSIIARTTNIAATGLCSTTVATITMSPQGIPHGYIVGDTVNLVGSGVFDGAVVVTSANDYQFTYTVSTTAVTTPVSCTVTVTTLDVNEYRGSGAVPTKYTVTQTLAALELAAPTGSCIPCTIVGDGTSSSLALPSLGYSALVFTGKTVNMRRVTGSTLTFGDMDRSSTTVTVTCALGHNLQVGEWVTIDSSNNALDGTYSVVAVTSSTVFTYTTTTSGTVTNATGTGYHDYTKIFLYEEGSKNNVYIANEVYSTLTPYISSLDVEHVPVAVNATATLTAAQVASGYISTTSTAAVSLTLPTGTLLGAQLKAKQGTVHDLYFDNTASSGSGEVTIVPSTDAIQSAWAVYQDVGGAPLTVVVGATGTSCYRLVFSSATTYTFCRIA